MVKHSSNVSLSHGTQFINGRKAKLNLFTSSGEVQLLKTDEVQFLTEDSGFVGWDAVFWGM
jgi:hypothetical protein